MMWENVMAILVIVIILVVGGLFFTAALYAGFRMGRISNGLDTPPMLSDPYRKKDDPNPVEEDPYAEAMVERMPEAIQTIESEK